MPTDQPVPNLVLTGFMGVGKSTIGRLAARRLGLPFVDVDALIVERSRRTIAEIFAQDGESGFRQIEAQICRELAARSGRVIATGGGALLNPDTLAAMSKTGVVVCLSTPIETLRHRLSNDPSRPLAADWQARLAARRAAYAAMPHQVNTAGKNATQTTEEVITLWRKYST